MTRWWVLALLLTLGACADESPNDTAAPRSSVTDPGPTISEPTGPDEVSSTGALPAAGAELDPDAPARWSVEIVESFPHDPEAFTQGLEQADADTVWESTGLRGQSTLRLVELATGEVLTSVPLAAEEFGEGLTVVDDTLLQLTWQERTLRRWQLPDLVPLAPLSYDTEGWGLCAAGDRLAMTDGSATLTWRDPETFAVLEHVTVTLDDQPVTRLNELECIDDVVVANVWGADQIVVIRPDGPVVAVIDASTLVAAEGATQPDRNVLNGIADLGDGTVLLGGKSWSSFYRVRIVP